MIYGKIFPTTRHSIHVRLVVRKATLNGPKPFGYFWASKVTKNFWHLDVHLDSARCSSKVQWMFISTVLHRCRDAHDVPLRYRKIPYLASSTFDFKTGYYPDLLRDLFEACSRIILSNSAFSEYVSNKVKAIIEIY